MSDKVKDGGPAFPINGDRGFSDGLSLRDYFAGQALVGALGGADLQNMSEGDMPHLVRSMYAIADLMLAERSKEKP